MSNYSPIVNYAPKDALTTGDPAKIIRGTELAAEFNSISSMSATKEDTSNKGIANGYAPLNASVLIADTYLTTNIPRLNSSPVFTGNSVRINGTDPFLALSETDAGVNEKNWLWQIGGGGILRLYAYDDALTASNAAITIDRTGTTVDSIAFAATTVTVNGVSVRDASILNAGTLPDGRFPATLPAVSGANLTALNATNLGSGTVPDARFPATLPAVSGVNLTSLNASNLGSGSIPDARVQASNVTQHQAALAINTDQLTTDVVEDAGTAFTVGSGDAESIRRFTSASAITVTLPNSVPSGWAVGDTIVIIRGGTGTVTFSSAGTIRSPGTSTVSVQNGKVAATLYASGVWELSGNV